MCKNAFERKGAKNPTLPFSPVETLGLQEDHLSSFTEKGCQGLSWGLPPPPGLGAGCKPSRPGRAYGAVPWDHPSPEPAQSHGMFTKESKALGEEEATFSLSHPHLGATLPPSPPSEAARGGNRSLGHSL